MAVPVLPPTYIEPQSSAQRRRWLAPPTVGVETPEAWTACQRFAAPYAAAAGLAAAWIASAGRPIEPRDFLAGIGGALLGWVVVSTLDATVF